MPTIAISWRVGAIVTILVGAASALDHSVPLASGLAVALLVPAALIDLRERRLPNLIVAAAAATFVVVLCLEVLLADRGVSWFGIVAGAGLLAGPLLALHLFSPPSMGFGDVKVAVVLGAAVGAVDWQLAIAALALAAGMTAAIGVALGVRTIAFGPGLVGATAVALAAHRLILTDQARDPITAIAASLFPPPWSTFR